MNSNCNLAGLHTATSCLMRGRKTVGRARGSLRLRVHWCFELNLLDALGDDFNMLMFNTEGINRGY